MSLTCVSPLSDLPALSFWPVCLFFLTCLCVSFTYLFVPLPHLPFLSSSSPSILFSHTTFAISQTHHLYPCSRGFVSAFPSSWKVFPSWALGLLLFNSKICSHVPFSAEPVLSTDPPAYTHDPCALSSYSCLLEAPTTQCSEHTDEVLFFFLTLEKKISSIQILKYFCKCCLFFPVHRDNKYWMNEWLWKNT